MHSLDAQAIEQLADAIASRVLQRLTLRADCAQELLTRLETAKYLRISPATLDRLVREGRIPSVLVGRRRMFRRSELAPPNE